MVDLLQETVRNRDYKLAYRFGCRELHCPYAHTTIFLHRTQKEVENFTSNINQICMQGHLTKPVKQCTHCLSIYELEDDICIYCEPRAKKRAMLVIKREELERAGKHEKDTSNAEIIRNNIIEIDIELENLAK